MASCYGAGVAKKLSKYELMYVTVLFDHISQHQAIYGSNIGQIWVKGLVLTVDIGTCSEVDTLHT